MSERYSRLFTLPENLYAVGSPVVIAAGTLLKDTQTGKIIAQLKLKNISPKVIKAVKVKLNLFDTAGNPLEESVVYDYLDLNVSRDIEFGQKNPVVVPNTKTRSYRVSVAEVVFVDRSVYTAGEENWEPLSKPSRLAFHDYELQRQYEIKFGGGSIYEAKAEKDLWHCTCGALNRDGEVCHICHNTLSALQTVDISALEKEKDARLAEEARVAAERAKKAAEELATRKAAAKEAQKKTAKFLKIAIPAVCLLIAIVVLITKVLIPNKQYNDAVALMDAGQFEEAIAAFEAMEGYKDSEVQIANCEKAIIDAEFAEAEALLEAGDYDGAIAIYNKLVIYKDVPEAETAKLNATYLSAKALAENGSYERAYKTFCSLGNYEDSRQQADTIYDKYISDKLKNIKVGDYLLFGFYEQDNNTDNGTEAIEWKVLDSEENRVLVISRNALDWKQFNTTADAEVTWETCSLRRWLNNDFINSAFSSKERKMIETATVTADPYFDGYYTYYNGNDTQDQIFLLSCDEAKNLFSSSGERICNASLYVQAIDEWNDDDPPCQWWLRTVKLGKVVYGPSKVFPKGQVMGGGYDATDYACIRPAMWITLQ